MHIFSLLTWWPGAHDFGHYVAAKRHGLQLYLPFYIPAGFGLLGSFGSITRVRGGMCISGCVY